MSVSAAGLTKYVLHTERSGSTLISPPIGCPGTRCRTAILSYNWKRKLVQQRARYWDSCLTALQMLASPALGTHRHPDAPTPEPR